MIVTTNMGKSAGYRVNKRNKEEILSLRRELSKCKESDWFMANLIFQDITTLTNNKHGPMSATPTPRACKFCGYFGHTKQHCEVRKEEEARAIEREIEKDRQWLASYSPGDEIPENGYLTDS